MSAARAGVPATIAAAIRNAAADLNLPDPGPERASRVIGLGLAQALAIAVPELPPERATEFAARYRIHFLAGESRLQLFPNARELLAHLREQRQAIAPQCRVLGNQEYVAGAASFHRPANGAATDLVRDGQRQGSGDNGYGSEGTLVA